MVRSPLLLTVVFLGSSTQILAQFVKQGCYDLAPITCPEVQAPILPTQDAMNFVDIETTCRSLMFDIIPQEIWFDPSQHAEYLNIIEASDPQCAQIQIAYGQCIFCGAFEVREDCRVRSKVVLCGGQPSREEILLDNESYPLFQTDADITAACDTLELFYGLREKDDGEPMFSVDLCERQKQVKHLCPGYCEGGCFTAEYPPSCEVSPETILNSIESRQAEGQGGSPPPWMIGSSPPLVNGSSAPWLNGSRPPQDDSGSQQGGQQRPTGPVCDQLGEKAFYQVDSVEVFNLSNHLEYLKSINKNDSFCPEARKTYSKCTWCNLDNLCFNDDNPPSCDPPSALYAQETRNYTLGEIERVCTGIYKSFFDIDLSKDIFNTSMHTSRIAIVGNNTICDAAKLLYHKCFWCEKRIELPSDFCTPKSACLSTLQVPDEFDLPADTFANMSNVSLEVAANCDEIYTSYKKANFIPRTLRGCYGELILSRSCPDQFCPEAEDAALRDESYLGADTKSEKLALIWLARVSAILSFLGASYVLYSSLSDANARKSVYHQLLIGMATFDIVTAMSWCLATIPIDASDTGTDHVYGVMGNEASCIAQGFFIQLGFTSVFYNVSLALYYVLVIARDWREFHLEKIRLFLHALPCMLGLGLALGAIGSYSFMGYACHLLPYPEGDLWAVLVFVIIPLGLSIAAITSSMMVVYCKVRQRASATRKWSFGVGKASVLEQAVFWQSVFYVFAFYITWPIMFAVYLGSVGVNGPLGLALVIAFVAPLSGFTNFLVFIRPKIINARKKRASQERIGSSLRSSFAATMRQILDPRRSSAADRSDSLDDDAQLMRRMDPSVAIAQSKRRLTIPDDVNANANEGILTNKQEVLQPVEEECAAENNLLDRGESAEADVEAEAEDGKRPPELEFNEGLSQTKQPALESVEESEADINFLNGRKKQNSISIVETT